MNVDVEAAVPVAIRPRIWAPLRGRDFRLLWFGGTAAIVGYQFSYVALAWLALQLTGSPVTLGALLTVAAVPRTALILVGGVLADRVPARSVAVASSIARAAAMSVLAALVLTRTAQLWQVFVLVLAFGISDAFYMPSRTVLIPQTVRPDELEAANSLMQTSMSVGLLVGPALGGLVVARFGTAFAFLGDAAGFVLVALAMLPLALPHRATPAAQVPSSFWSDLRGGMHYVFKDPALRAMLLLTAAVNAAVTGPIDVGIAYLSRLQLGGAWAFGILLAGLAAGSVAGSIASGMRGRRPIAPLIAVVCVTFGLGLPLLGVARSLPIALADTLLMGLAAGYISVAALAAMQRRVRPQVMGRVMSLFMLGSTGVGPISFAVSGFVAGLSLVLLFAAAGLVVLAAGGCSLASGEVRGLD